MTYEELLADIESKNYRESRTLDTPYAALRAVLELHKPDKGLYGPSCLECDDEFAGHHPCVTIQAIQKELA